MTLQILFSGKHEHSSVAFIPIDQKQLGILYVKDTLQILKVLSIFKWRLNNWLLLLLLLF